MAHKTTMVSRFLIGFLFICSHIQAQVINELYVGGGNTGATYINDAVVLKGTAGASLNGWSIQYASAAGSSWSGSQISFAATAVFNAQGNFYIGLGSGGANGVALPNPPFTPGGTSYASGAFNMSATGGKIAFRNTTTAIPNGTTCPAGVPTGTGVDILDFVGYGTANCAEGAGATGSPEAVPATPATQSMMRTGGADTNHNANDFSAFSVNFVLPIELLDFQVKREKDEILIYWVTAREKDNSQFVVEHSKDGKKYEELSVVKGAGTTSLLQQYSIIDTDPYAGMNYYRLKQVDEDGKFDYSYIRSINFGDGYAISLSPNPVAEGSAVALNIQSENEAELTISIFNALGQLVLQKQMGIENGENQLQVDISQLSKGVYTLHCQEGAGFVDVQQLLIK